MFQQKQTFLPNTIIIGAMKSGTTSLHKYLSCHPQIFTSEIKELDYFVEVKNWKRGLEWYKSYFTEPSEIRCEASPNYSKCHRFPGVPEKMYRLIPDAKLIYLVRDPIKRILSQYIHRLSNGLDKSSIEDVLADPETKYHYVNCSKYYMQLESYLKYYSPSNILVIPSEDLAKNRIETLQKIFQFLNVDPNFQHPDFFTITHQSKDKQQVTDLNLRLSKLPGGTLIKSSLFHLLSPSIAKKLLWSPIIEPPAIADSTGQGLIDLLQEDVQNLRNFTGYSFSNWSI